MIGELLGEQLLEHVATLLDLTVDLSTLAESVKGAERVLLVVNTDVEPDL